MRQSVLSWHLRVVLLVLGVVGCTPEPQFYLDAEQLLDPNSCQGCHPAHYEQWSGSMHAYTGIDPIFRAQNRAGQLETDGELGSHCVSCHSPMAVRANATEDGLNLSEVDPALRGVTCAACHLVERIETDHNAGHVMATDGKLRGGIMNPVANPAHDSGYSTIHDRNQLSSSEMCGSCHCVWSSNEVHVERTLHEWRETVFATGDLTRQTCGNCHMRGYDGVAATTGGLPVRRLHDHSWPGVDTALVEFPQRDRQSALIQEELNNSLLARICVHSDEGLFRVDVTLENVGAGHSFPSGTAVDRRVWVELRAWVGEGEVFSSGVVDDVEAVTSLADPNLWLMRDRHTDAEGMPVNFPWQTATVESELLPASVTNDPLDPLFEHDVTHKYWVGGTPPDRVEMRVRMRAVGLEVLAELVEQGDLDPTLAAIQPTWTLESTHLTWEGEIGSCVPD